MTPRGIKPVTLQLVAPPRIRLQDIYMFKMTEKVLLYLSELLKLQFLNV